MARLLGGRVNGDAVQCPGPGHSASDRSLSVKIDANAPDGFLVHSFAADDLMICRDRRLKATASWFQPATCWTALVGYSGTGKTPGHTVTRRAAKEVEQAR